MTKTFDVLRDARSYLSLGAGELDALANALVAGLGASWTRSANTRERVISVRHGPTELVFVVVPGGPLRMGISDADLTDATAVLGEGLVSGAIARETARARPVHDVVVVPFLASERLLTSADVRRLSDGARRSDTLKRTLAIDLSTKHGLRLPSEAELEWMARDARGLGSTLDVFHRADASDDEGDLPSELGLRDVLRATWARDDWHDDYQGAPSSSDPWLDGDPAGVYRAGPLLPVLDRSELWVGLAGLRSRGLERDETGKECVPDVMVRLAHDLPFVSDRTDS